MINGDTDEIISEIQDNLQIHEDPSMYETGHRNDPVTIEVPEETTRQSDANTLRAFARLVPSSRTGLSNPRACSGKLDQVSPLPKT
jgi:spartin